MPQIKNLLKVCQSSNQSQELKFMEESLDTTRLIRVNEEVVLAGQAD